MRAVERRRSQSNFPISCLAKNASIALIVSATTEQLSSSKLSTLFALSAPSDNN
jgi:hypothetical protein